MTLLQHSIADMSIFIKHNDTNKLEILSKYSTQIQRKENLGLKEDFGFFHQIINNWVNSYYIIDFFLKVE